MPRSAMAASAASPPASWRAWPRSASRPTATASATSTACSARRSLDGWQVELPETWLALGNPWEFERREVAYEIGFGGAVESITSRTATPSAMSGSRPRRVIAVAYDTPIVGWRGQPRQHAAPLDGRADRPDPARRLQRRRPYRRARREQPRRGAHPRALSGRRDARRARNCACGRSTSSPRPRCRTSCAATCSSTARSTTCPTRSRSSSTTPIRRSRVAELMRLLVDVHGIDLDEAWEHHPAARSATPTTPCCPRRWRPGRCRSSSGCCRATCRSSTRSTPAPARGARKRPQDERRRDRARSR